MNNFMSKYYKHQIIVQIQDVLVNINFEKEIGKGNITEDDAKALLNFLDSDNVKLFVKESLDDDKNELFIQLLGSFGRNSQHLSVFLAENPVFLQYEMYPEIMDMNDTTYHLLAKKIGGVAYVQESTFDEYCSDLTDKDKHLSTLLAALLRQNAILSHQVNTMQDKIMQLNGKLFMQTQLNKWFESQIGNGLD